MFVSNKISYFIACVFFISLISGCGSSPQAVQTIATEASIPIISLASPDEPGQQLILYGTVVDSHSGESLPGARVYLYQADANGEYLPSDPEDESTAKLSGEVVTGSTGQFTVHTIVPRWYDAPGNQHIHIHYARADGYAEIGKVILFEDDVNDEVRQWANETGFGIIIDLVERGGVMEGDVIIRLTPES